MSQGTSVGQKLDDLLLVVKYMVENFFGGVGG